MRSSVADGAKSAKAVFLDRDGVINRDSADYVKSLAEFSLIPGSVEAIAKLTQAGYEVFVITNQSGLARGIIDMAGLEEIHRYMKNAVREAGGEIRGVYFCPHLPDEGCDCRKPSPGLIRKAAEENDLDISKAVMIGDKGTDIECAQRAGCKGAYLVKTGIRELPGRDRMEEWKILRAVADDLFQAADWLIADEDDDNR